MQIDKYASMPRLRFLHLQNPLPAERLVAEGLAEDVPTLEHIGLGRSFWRIDREGTRDGQSDEVRVTRTQLSRLMLGVMHDEEWADERWLMEWHDDLE
jgi:hypothetical protein